MFDTIIIGGGPAGMSAAIYLARKRMKILMLTEDFGGQTTKAADVSNYLGFNAITGIELIQKFTKHLESLSVESKSNTRVKEIKKKDGGFEVITKEETLEAKAVIICSGKTSRRLNVPGEEEFSGKGVSYCATCDGPLFRDKTVAVIGGGNSALDAAVELEKYAKAVNIINVNEEVAADAILKEKFGKSEKGKIIANAETQEVYGDPPAGGFVKGLKYKDLKTGEIKDLPTDGIFVEIGWSPSTDFVKNLVELNELGEIKTQKNGETSQEGIYAAGDATDTPFKQIIIAAGDGARAALSAWKYLITKK